MRRQHTLALFALPNGELLIAHTSPRGALVLTTGTSRELHESMRATATLGDDGHTWFVPDLRHTHSQHDRVQALIDYERKLQHYITCWEDREKLARGEIL